MPEPLDRNAMNRRQLQLARENLCNARNRLADEAKDRPLSGVQIAYAEICSAINRIDLIELE